MLSSPPSFLPSFETSNELVVAETLPSPISPPLTRKKSRHPSLTVKSEVRIPPSSKSTLIDGYKQAKEGKSHRSDELLCHRRANLFVRRVCFLELGFHYWSGFSSSGSKFFPRHPLRPIDSPYWYSILPSSLSKWLMKFHIGMSERRLFSFFLFHCGSSGGWPATDTEISDIIEKFLAIKEIFFFFSVKGDPNFLSDQKASGKYPDDINSIL